MKKKAVAKQVRRRDRVDEQAILEKLLALSMHTWRYVHEPKHIRHIGPMAEDFSEAFGLGGSNRVIALADAVGVAYSSIRALHKQIEARRREVRQLIRKVDGKRGGLA